MVRVCLSLLSAPATGYQDSPAPGAGTVSTLVLMMNLLHFIMEDVKEC